MCSVDLLEVNYNSQLSQPQTFWLPLHSTQVSCHKLWSNYFCHLDCSLQKTLRKHSDGGQHITLSTIHQTEERRKSDYCISAEQRHNKLKQDLNLSRHNSIERTQNVVLSRRSSHGLGHKLGPLQLFYNRDVDFDSFPG